MNLGLLGVAVSVGALIGGAFAGLSRLAVTACAAVLAVSVVTICASIRHGRGRIEQAAGDDEPRAS
jgi:hypothetical protein